MDAFDVRRLTDFDFEAVVKDLMEESLGVPLEIFSVGMDDGVDLRFASASRKHEIVVQCKHWVRSDRSSLIRYMRNHELPKIRRLNPRRYILATSTSLTKGSKDQLVGVLSEFGVTSSDIFGGEEIEAMLRNYPDIVRRHLRLWLSSSAILDSLLNKATLIRSASLVRECRETLDIYAPNDSFARAEEILTKQHVCVIAGIPGIGKTTLAQVLAAAYLKAGFEIIEISENIEEANSAWSDRVNQFFYYDDFLGQTTFGDSLGKNEDSRLLRFMRLVAHTPNKRLVMTSREYILALARQRYERLSHHDFTPLKCIIDLSDYTDVVRAEILYNHVYRSTVSATIKRVFAQSGNYSRILSHPNFNPRVIQLSLQLPPLKGDGQSESPNETVQRVLNSLDDPASIWEHIVQNQLSDDAVTVLEVFAARLVQWISPGLLLKYWVPYRQIDTGSAASRALTNAIHQLEGTMLKINTPRPGEARILYHNPSVRDYMHSYLAMRPGIIHELVVRADDITVVGALLLLSLESNTSGLSETLKNDWRSIEHALLRTAGTESRYNEAGWPRPLHAKMLILALRFCSARAIQVMLEDVLEAIVLDIDLHLQENSARLKSLLIDLRSAKSHSVIEYRVKIGDAIARHLIGLKIGSWDEAELALAAIFKFGVYFDEERRRVIHNRVNDFAFRLCKELGSADQLAEGGYATAVAVAAYLEAFYAEDERRMVELGEWAEDDDGGYNFGDGERAFDTIYREEINADDEDDEDDDQGDGAVNYRRLLRVIRDERFDGDTSAIAGSIDEFKGTRAEREARIVSMFRALSAVPDDT